MNKKLVKALACVSCGLGIASSIPFITASCGCSQKEVDLPDDVYDIDEATGTLKGFKENINWSKYSSCNTMLIPSSVAAIADYAFGVEFYSSKLFTYQIYNSPPIPQFLKTLKFSNNDKEITFGECCFAFNSFENIYLPKKFILSGEYFIPVFACSQNLKHIYLNEKTQDKYVYSKSFGNKCQVIVKKEETFTGVAGGLATGFVDFTKDRSITEIPTNAFAFCSSIYGYRFSNNIASIDIGAFKYNTGLDANQLSFEEGNKKYGFATNLGDNAKFLVENSGTEENPKFEYYGQVNVFCLAAGDIDYTYCDAAAHELYFCSVSSIIFNSSLIYIPGSSAVDWAFLSGNKQLKSITFKYGIRDTQEQKLMPKPWDFWSNPNLKYIEFDGYHTDIDGFTKNFVFSGDDKTCFDYIARGGKVKASDCDFSSDELLEYLKANTQTDWDPFKDWTAAANK